VVKFFAPERLGVTPFGPLVDGDDGCRNALRRRSPGSELGFSILAMFAELGFTTEDTENTEKSPFSHHRHPEQTAVPVDRMSQASGVHDLGVLGALCGEIRPIGVRAPAGFLPNRGVRVSRQHQSAFLHPSGLDRSPLTRAGRRPRPPDDACPESVARPRAGIGRLVRERDRRSHGG
jgi:hypothetical protein